MDALLASVHDDVTPVSSSVSSLAMADDIQFDMEDNTSSELEDLISNSDISGDVEPGEINPLWEYNVLKTLGEGNFGTMKLAEHRLTGYQVAIKILNKPEDPAELDQIYREAEIQMSLDHPNIVKMYEVIETNSEIFLVMEYCKGGDLLNCTLKHEGEKTAKKIFRQIASALQYCHANNVVHRDIKLDNILVAGDDTFKLADFGLADIFYPGTFLTSICGAVSSVAPELLSAKPYVGPEVDIWSLGVLLHNMVAREYPFKGNTEKEILKAVKRGQYRPPAASKACRDLIHQMLTVDPRRRATMQEIMESRWLREDSQGPSGREPSGTASSSDPVSLNNIQTSFYSPERPRMLPPRRRCRLVRWWRAVKNFFAPYCCCRCCSETYD